MLHIARDNTNKAQDRAHFYADHNTQPHVFNPRQKVFLRVPHDSEKLSINKCTKPHSFVDLSQSSSHWFINLFSHSS